jgi:Tfp pilus assembly protein PilE
MNATRRQRADSGATLIEMLVAVLVLGIIAVPLGNVVISVLRNSDRTSGRLAESHDAQVTAAYWAQDVAGVGARDRVDPYSPALKASIEQNVAATSGTNPCGTAASPAAIVRFASDDATAGGTTVVVVAYAAVRVGSRYSLHRMRCAGSTTPVSDLVLAHDLLAVPTVQCDGSPSCPAVPTTTRKITLAMTVQDPATDGTTYPITLDGQRRQA